ncbi:hypothetical protein HRG_005758 [Hirsutella rhossiliensis]|uniref:Vegetative incompatibility protein HET-E-1 n=1 Tax=Hirsutella rhossiliensis TaxID=111463 RepID=A0A9P8MVZ9_9HYPO|nr:uncharacterized protein HRG_05758 [Hirsutella rhossiliensis]KAH0963248.1 hypothetical protein HRG_05758 [Hirsutella rhossiliensis]
MADHDKTHKALEKWVCPKKHVVAAHYFWTLGSKTQKSQKGLLQTFLYDVFRISPELKGDECTLHELLDALRRIAEHRAFGVGHCIFIDGIDDFDGDHFELRHLLQTLSRSANLKFCLSSRPLNVFEDAFGADPASKLYYIHDLTRQDILPFWSRGVEYANDAIAEAKELAFAHLDAVEQLYLDMPSSRDSRPVMLPLAHVLGAIMAYESKVELQLDGIKGALQVQLKKLTKQILEPRRLRLVSRMVQKIAKTAIDEGLEMDFTIPSIKALFPGRSASALVTLVWNKRIRDTIRPSVL